MKISRGIPSTSYTSFPRSARIEHSIKQLNGKIKRLKSGGDELDAGQQMLLDSYKGQMTMLKETLQEQTKNQTHKMTSTLEQPAQSNASAQSTIEGLSQQTPRLEVTFSITTYA